MKKSRVSRLRDPDIQWDIDYRDLLEDHDYTKIYPAYGVDQYGREYHTIATIVDGCGVDFDEIEKVKKKYGKLSRSRSVSIVKEETRSKHRRYNYRRINKTRRKVKGRRWYPHQR